MPIAFDLKKIREQHACEVYLETGLYDPRIDVSCKKALRCNFDRVYCIEIREDWVLLGNQILDEYIRDGRLRLIHDDSTNLANHMVNNPDFTKKTLFFLDAHVDNSNIHNYTKRCPLFQELTAIKQLPRNDNVIMIDDMRIVSLPFPWGETSYGNIDFLDSIKSLILDINPDYKFTYLDGHVSNDVLMAYV